MREKLKELNEERKTFIGLFERFGWKSGYKRSVETVLMQNIKDEDGNYICDHLWFNKTKGFAEAELKEGDKVSFVARVKKYEKGYKGYREDVCKSIEIDYKLSHPTKIINLGQ